MSVINCSEKETVRQQAIGSPSAGRFLQEIKKPLSHLSSTQGTVPLRTILLLSIFAAVDIAASTGFVLLRIIMVSATQETKIIGVARKRRRRVSGMRMAFQSSRQDRKAAPGVRAVNFALLSVLDICGTIPAFDSILRP